MSETSEPTVRVEYRKYDGTLRWNLLTLRLGADEHGTRLGLPAVSSMRKGDGQPVPIPQPHVILFPPDTGYTAVFNGEPAKSGVYSDLTSPSTWHTPDLVTMVDLDVLRRRGENRALPVDEDGSAEHEVRCGHPRHGVDPVQSAARDLLQAATDHSGAFAGVRRVRLAKATALGVEA